MSALEQPVYKPHRPPLDNLDPLTDEQRQTFLDIIRDDPRIGLIAALKRLDLVNPNGYTPTRGQLRRLLEAEDGLEEQSREARGWNLVAVEDVLWQVAVNPDHKFWASANERVLKAYRSIYRDRGHVDVEHTGEVDNPDVAAAIERFTAGVVQLAERRRAELVAGDSE